MSMRTTLLIVVAASILGSNPAMAGAGDEAGPIDVGFVVLRENGTGSASRAQTYLDALLGSIAERNEWDAAHGRYFTSRKKAVKYIEDSKPSFGFFSFGAYLGLRAAHGLVPLAVADATAVGGAQYFVISKHEVTLAGCVGKRLASNHASDPRYIDAVVSGDDFDLSDFELVTTRRPVQTLKAVIDDDAECALVDDSQIATLTAIDRGWTLRPVWHSAPVPGIVIAATSAASSELRATFEKNLPSTCEGDGLDACEAAGVRAIQLVQPAEFSEQESAYGD